MESTGLISIQKYASMNHLSIHNVIKKTMNGELLSVVKQENGKDVTYILLDSSKNNPKPVNTPDHDTDEIDYKKAYDDLHKEYLMLKTKYEKLLQSTTHA